MHVSSGHFVGNLRGDRLSLGNLLRLQAVALQHVHEVHVAAKVQLVGAVQPHSPVFEQLGEYSVNDGGPDLGLDVVSHDRNSGVFELLRPYWVGGDEDGQGVDEGNTCIDSRLRIVAGGIFGTDGQVAHKHISLSFFQLLRYVYRLDFRFRHHALVVLSQAV